jgi:hypothetical protein
MDHDTMLEGMFNFYCGLGLNFYIHMTRAKSIAFDYMDGKNSVTYEDYLTVKKIRTMLEGSKERYELLKDNTDLPYEDAYRYIVCMLDECSLITRIYLSKHIDLGDICYHIDLFDSVGPDEYNKLFLTELSPEDRKIMLDFQQDADSRKDIILAQLVVALELGL